jgi:hypothetical protein
MMPPTTTATNFNPAITNFGAGQDPNAQVGLFQQALALGQMPGMGQAPTNNAPPGQPNLALPQQGLNLGAANQVANAVAPTATGGQGVLGAMGIAKSLACMTGWWINNS